MNVATRSGKGSRAAINYMRKYLIIMKNKYDEFYVLKCDIKKYFYNIDHEILFRKLERYIYDIDILNILHNIVDSTNCSYVNESIASIVKKTGVSMPFYKFNKGLPIGNQTSQILAIFYLNDMDHFIKEKLHIKYYIRYMDDFILIHKDKKYLEYCYLEIVKFLSREKLELNNKTNIYNMCDGVTFLGYRYVFKGNKLIMLMPSATEKIIINRIKRKETSVDNYNSYLIGIQIILSIIGEKNKIYIFIYFIYYF